MSLSLDPVLFLNERKFTVLFSGGKDSLAALLWVLDNVEHENWNVLYVEVTGNTHPLCNQYVHEVTRELGIYKKLVHVKREDLDFFDCLRKWGIPVIGKYRWCLSQFKQRFFADKRLSHITQVTGIKWADSNRRKHASFIEVFRITKSVIVHPILTWSKKDVNNYVKQHGLELNPCYGICGHSGNCMFCPYHDKRSVILTLSLPEWREKILSALLAKKAGSQWQQKIKHMWTSLASQSTLEVKALA